MFLVLRPRLANHAVCRSAYCRTGHLRPTVSLHGTVMDCCPVRQLAGGCITPGELNIDWPRAAGMPRQCNCRASGGSFFSLLTCQWWKPPTVCRTSRGRAPPIGVVVAHFPCVIRSAVLWWRLTHASLLPSDVRREPPVGIQTYTSRLAALFLCAAGELVRSPVRVRRRRTSSPPANLWLDNSAVILPLRGRPCVGLLHEYVAQVACYA